MTDLPELQKLQEQFKGTSIKDYIKNHLQKERPFQPLDEESYKIFKSNFNRKEIKRIATGSHMGAIFWDFPLCFGETIIAQLPTMLNDAEPIVMTPCSRIPMQNESRPGIIDLSHMGNASIHLSKYALRGRSKITVNKAQPITKKEIGNVLHEFRKFQKNPQVFKFINQEKLAVVIDALAGFENEQTFNGQASALSSRLWQEITANGKQQPLQIKPMETLRLKRENLLENKQMRELLEKHFEGSYGATTSTYFYYGSCRCGKEFPLKKIEEGAGIQLVGTCSDQKCENKETYKTNVSEIIEEVERGNLSESLFMQFYNLWLLTGVDIMGGFNQIHYTKEFRDNLAIIFKKLGNEKRSKLISARATNLLDLGIIPIFNQDGSPKTGSQVFLEGGFEESYLKRLSELEFSSAIDVSRSIINTVFGEKPNYSEVISLLKKNNMEFMIK